MAGSRVPKDDISPEMRRFLDDMARRQDTPSSVFSSTENGLVPLSGGGTLNFLRSDGSWAPSSDLFKVLAASETGQNVNTVQPWFPAGGAVTVAASTTYFVDGLLHIEHGTTAHTTGVSFTGTATLTSIDYRAMAFSATLNALSNGESWRLISTAANQTVRASSVLASTVIDIRGMIRINAAGTLIPNFTFSADPTGTITIHANSFFRLQPIGTNVIATQGTWA